MGDLIGVYKWFFNREVSCSNKLSMSVVGIIGFHNFLEL